MRNLFFTSVMKRWWFPIVLINSVFLIFTVAGPYATNFPQIRQLISPLTLASENNIAAWWSGVSLLMVALLIFEKFNFKNLPWLVIAFILAGLSLDEIGSIHERVGVWKGWYGILPFGALLICLAAYSIIKIYLNSQSKRNAIYIFIGFTLFGIVAGQEYIEHLISWNDLKSSIDVVTGTSTGDTSTKEHVQKLNILKDLLSGLRVGMEEGTELLGIFFLFIAVLYQDTLKNKLNATALIPKYETFLNLRTISIIGLIIHIIGCYICIKYVDFSRRGNPMNWYPVAMFFSMFLLSIRASLELEKSRRTKWVLLSVLYLISSLSIMTVPNLFLIIFPGIENILSTELIQEKFMLFSLVQIIAIALVINDSSLYKNPPILIGITLILSLVVLGIWGDILWVRYSVLGIHAFYMFLLLCIAIQTKRTNVQYQMQNLD